LESLAFIGYALYFIVSFCIPLEMPERHQNGVYTDETGRQTVFDAILDAEPDRSTKGLVDEAFSLVIGGTETTDNHYLWSLVHFEESQR
jgi:cytochrome P450